MASNKSTNEQLNSPPATEQWGSRIGVILAVAGSAVGLGNFLRFPGQAAQNGGGVFMIPYFIAFLLLGIPICWAEWTMGRYGGSKGFNSCPNIFRAIGGHRVWSYIGVIGVLIPVIVYMYYVLIESWCLAYAVHYALGWIELGPDPSYYAARSKDFFNQVTGASSDGLVIAGEIHSSVYVWLIVFTLNFILIYRGITKGIEAFCKYAVPAMALCAIVVLVRVLTLGTPNPDFPDRTVLNGLGFMWNPKSNDGVDWWVALLNPDIWVAATGQIFFSLSVGFGIIVNYASYLKRKSDIVLSSLTASSTNEFFEVCLGGLITVPAAFVFLGASGTVGGTFGLGFNTLPVVFEYMPGGHFFGFLWFFMLFLAAITSSLSMLQPAIAFLKESLKLDRKSATGILGLITFLGSLFVLYFSKDLTALDTLDFWVGTVLIFVLATVQVFLFSWVFGIKRGMQELEIGAELKVPKFFPFVIKYISPFYLLTILILWSVVNLPQYISNLGKGGIALLSVFLIIAVTVFFMLIVNISERKASRALADN